MIRTPHSNTRIPLGIFDSDLTVSGTRTGAFVTASIVLIAFVAIPLARPFLLGTVGLGSLLGMVMWWRHRQPHKSGFDGGDGPILNVTQPSGQITSEAFAKQSQELENFDSSSRLSPAFP